MSEIKRICFKLPAENSNDDLFVFFDFEHGMSFIEPSLTRIKMKAAIAHPEVELDFSSVMNVSDFTVDQPLCIKVFENFNAGRDLSSDSTIAERGRFFSAVVRTILPENCAISMSASELHDRISVVELIALSLTSCFESAAVMMMIMNVAGTNKASRVALSTAAVQNPHFITWRSRFKALSAWSTASSNDRDRELHCKLVRDPASFPEWRL